MAKTKLDGFTNLKPLVIPTGAVLMEGPRETKRTGKVYELLLGLGKDHTAELYIDEEALQACPELFARLHSGNDLLDKS